MKTRDAIRAFCWLLSAQAARPCLNRPRPAPPTPRSWRRQVQIRRTQYGVPHIQGESLEAAAFGFGYCQAEDHLHNILRGILGARGELAQLSARATTRQNVEADFFNRHFRVYRRAVATYHKLDPDYRSMVEGFAAGLNYYVERHRGQRARLGCDGHRPRRGGLWPGRRDAICLQSQQPGQRLSEVPRRRDRDVRRRAATTRWSARTCGPSLPAAAARAARS